MVWIRNAGGIASDYAGPKGTMTSGEAIEEWNVEAAIPPAGRWSRAGFWISEDAHDYCDSVGRSAGLCVLEFLHHDAGFMAPSDSVILGSRVDRDQQRQRK